MNQEYIKADDEQNNHSAYDQAHTAPKMSTIVKNIARDLFSKGVEKLQQQGPVIGGVFWYCSEKTRLPVVGYRILGLLAAMKFFWLTLIAYGLSYVWLNPKLANQAKEKWQPYQKKYFEQ